MNEVRKNELTVGLTVLMGIAVLAFGMAFFKDCSFGDVSTRVHMRFPESSGLQIGDIVTLSGVKAGQVSAVVLEDSTVLVSAVMNEDILVTADAIPIIQMLELMGGKKIEIRQGRSPMRYVESMVLMGIVDPDISGALGMLGSLDGDLQTMTKSAADVLHRVNTRVLDSAAVNDMRAIIRNTREITEVLNLLTTKHSNDIGMISRSTASLSQRADSLVAALSPRLDSALLVTTGLASNADVLVTDLREMVTEIRQSRGMFNALLHDTTLICRINRLVDRIDTLTTVIVDGQMRIKIRL